MKKKSILILFFLFSLIFSGSAKANYWLIIGTYRQGPGGRPEVSGITSPSLHSIPMKDLDTCTKAGEKITNENVKSIRPGYGLSPKFLDKIIYKRTKVDVKRGQPVKLDLIK